MIVLSAYLPEVVVRSPADAGRISLRDLLALRHGLEDDGPIVFRTAFSGEHSRAEPLRLLAGYGPGEQGRTSTTEPSTSFGSSSPVAARW
jgi:hypothetical protein